MTGAWLASVAETLLKAFTGSANETALTAAAPSAPNAMPSEPPDARVAPVSLPVPNGSVAAVRPPSSTLPTTEPVSVGVSSVTVTLKSLDSVTVLPSKSTACTRPDRSMVAAPDPLSSGSSRLNVHEPSPLTWSVNTWSPCESVAVSVWVVVSIVAPLIRKPCDVRCWPARKLPAVVWSTSWNAVALAPSAPNCTRVCREPAVAEASVAELGSLPVP